MYTPKRMELWPKHLPFVFSPWSRLSQRSSRAFIAWLLQTDDAFLRNRQKRTLSFRSLRASNDRFCSFSGLSTLGPMQMARLLASILLTSEFLLMTWSTETRCLSSRWLGCGSLSATLERSSGRLVLGGAHSLLAWGWHVESFCLTQTSFKMRKVHFHKRRCETLIQTLPVATDTEWIS